MAIWVDLEIPRSLPRTNCLLQPTSILFWFDRTVTPPGRPLGHGKVLSNLVNQSDLTNRRIGRASEADTVTGLDFSGHRSVFARC
ncbi:hypothetical protein Rcae01_06557 [Novipirellula caenicola]|uniref:Uncharacterized protein n=1 Tax=Novipirellula caenicola TaxID=1536901 RepID=A0ABP9W0Y8_9BACT